MESIKTALNNAIFSKIIILLGIAAIAVGTANRNALAYVIYTDQTNWENAVTGGLTTDNFAYSIPSANNITFSSGVDSTRSGSNYQAVNGSVFVGQVTGSTTLTWDFNQDISAFGFDIVSVNNQTSLVADFDGNGNESINLGVLSNSTYYNGFFGIIGEDSFNSIVFGNSGLVDTFTIDNLSFNEVTVPEPATLILLVSGILAMRLFGHKKQTT